MPKVGVFISWSGNSRGVASALYDWLPTALHSIDPWMSEYDIHKGTRFLEELERALLRCRAGIICITPENKDSVWVAFESGALASRVVSKLVIPLVSRMRPSDVVGPLGMFQGSELTKPDMLRLITNLNELNLDEDRIVDKRLAATFEGVWPELERKLPDLENEQIATVEEVEARKSDTQILEEILDVSKSMRILIEDQLRGSAGGLVGDDVASQSTSPSHEPMSSGAGLQGRETYESLAEHVLKASEIWMVGISLLTVVDQYYTEFIEYVKRERLNLRFLLLDPEDGVLVDAATRSLYGVTAPEDLRYDITRTVAKITELRDSAHDPNSVQLRYLNNFPSTSIIMTDPTRENGTAIAEFYPYRASSSDRPHIALNAASQPEHKWFLFYRDQFLAMWRDAKLSPGVLDDKKS